MSTTQHKFVGKIFKYRSKSQILLLRFDIYFQSLVPVPYVHIYVLFSRDRKLPIWLLPRKGRTPTLRHYLMQKYCGLYAGKYGTYSEIELGLYFDTIYLHTKFHYNPSNVTKVIERNHICYGRKGGRRRCYIPSGPTSSARG